MEKKPPRQTELEILYAVGNFIEARPLAAAILKDDHCSDSERNTAQRLSVAMSTDPVVTLVFGGTLFLLLFISIKYLL